MVVPVSEMMRQVIQEPRLRQLSVEHNIAYRGEDSRAGEVIVGIGKGFVTGYRMIRHSNGYLNIRPRLGPQSTLNPKILTIISQGHLDGSSVKRCGVWCMRTGPQGHLT